MFESIHQRTDGSTFPVLVAISCVKDDAGHVLYRVSNVQDITVRKEIETRLAQDGDLLSALMDDLPDSVFIKDVDSRYIWINPAAARLLGYSEPSKAIGKTGFDFYPHGQAQQSFAEEQRVILSGESLINTVEHKTSADGVPRSSLSTEVPIRDKSHRIVGIVGISWDYTEIKAVEDAQARLAAIVESATDAIVSTTLDGIVSSWNPGAN